MIKQKRGKITKATKRNINEIKNEERKEHRNENDKTKSKQKQHTMNLKYLGLLSSRLQLWVHKVLLQWERSRRFLEIGYEGYRDAIIGSGIPAHVVYAGKAWAHVHESASALASDAFLTMILFTCALFSGRVKSAESSMS